MKIEDNTFRQLYIDLTHRCNMSCNICYAVNRNLPDITVEYIDEVCRKLPKTVIFRLLGGEPTLNENLFEIIETIHKYRHMVSLITNGKKLADFNYAKELKKVLPYGISISFDGGWYHKEIYNKINGEDCKFKFEALENLHKLNFRRVAVCGILIRDLNDDFLIPDLLSLAKKYEKTVKWIHVRSMAKYGKWIDTIPYKLPEMKNLLNKYVKLEKLKERPLVPECKGCPGCYRASMDNYQEISLIDFTPELCIVRGQVLQNYTIIPHFENMEEYKNVRDYSNNCK